MKEKYDSEADTLRHIKRINQLLGEAATELLGRAHTHDGSKLEDPEKAEFDRVSSRLKDLTYGSDEYKASLEDLKIALVHHYANNPHHPEHYARGIDGMNLFDIIEMFFDWKAATERHDNGNIYKSIEHNKERFEMSDQLVNIYINTAEKLGYKKPE